MTKKMIIKSAAPTNAMRHALNLLATLPYLSPSNLPIITYPPLHVMAEISTTGKKTCGFIRRRPAATEVYPRK